MRTRVTLVAVGTLLVSLLPNVSGATQDLPAGLDDPPYLDRVRRSAAASRTCSRA